MTIELPNAAQQAAIASIQRYFQQNMDEPIGNITAGALLGFFLEEIGPLVYNKRSPTFSNGYRPESRKSTSRSMRTNSSTGASSTKRRRPGNCANAQTGSPNARNAGRTRAGSVK